MAETEHTPTTSRNKLTRRAALRGTAAAAAAVLPAGVAAAATKFGKSELDSADPGLARLEAGYAKWQKLNARVRALYEQEDFAFDGEMYRLIDRRNALRRRLMKIKTRSPNGVIIKIAMGVGAASLDFAEIEDACKGNESIDNMFPALLADLQAMEGRAVA